MRSLFKDPLLHFIVGGALLFAVYNWTAADAPVEDPRVIEIDRPALLTFIQFRMKMFDPDAAARYLDHLTPDARDELVQQYVREEALYREAVALGLGEDDYVIRRRLVQKVDYVARDLNAALAGPDSAYVEQYYSDHRQDYTIPPVATFTHVFFDARRRGWDEAGTQAALEVDRLNGDRVPFSGAGAHGDRFLYQRNYVDRSFEEVETDFGGDLAAAVFALAPDAGRWQGPIRSDHGVHVVMVTRNEAGRLPPLEEIRPLVEADAARALESSRREAILNGIVRSYEVRLTGKLEADAVTRVGAAELD